MIKKIILTITIISTLSGCATMFNNEPKTVHVYADTTKELVLIRNDQIVRRYAKLPRTLSIPNGWSDWELQDIDGNICPIGQTVNLATLLNLILGGIIGIAVDTATGNIVRADDAVYCDI